MGHTYFYLTDSGKTRTSEILPSFSDRITNVWKSVFSEGSSKIVEDTMYLSVGDLNISILSSLQEQSGCDSGNYIACMLRSSDTVTMYDYAKNIVNQISMVYGINKRSPTSGRDNLNDPVYLHIITGKQNKTIMMGLSDSQYRVGAQVLVSRISDDDYIGIQLGVTKCDNYYYSRNNNRPVSNAANERYDVYIKDPDTISRTQSFYGPGWYVTPNILTIVPSIDPWRGELIPDTYISITGPLDKAGLDGVISIGNRKFMTGHTYSYNGTSDQPALDNSNEYIYDGGIVTFVEI